MDARCTTIQAPADLDPASQAAPGDLQVEEVHKVSKVKLCRDNGIQPRDLRSLDTDMRHGAHPSSNVSCVTHRSPTLRIYCSRIPPLSEIHTLSRTSTELTTRANQLLKSMSSQDVISTAQMQEMIEVKDSNEVFLRAATSVKDAVAEILSEPDDMRKMYLTELRNGKARELGDDDEVELLLETYLKYAASLTLNASRNLQRLNSASQHLTLLLSSTRNRLLHLEIRLAIATLAVSSAALPGAILGMNLTNHFEDHPWAFYAVTCVIALIGVIATQAGRAGLRVARRVKMEQAGLLAGGKPAVRPP
ncbi:mitochondrial inner membrane magnesium transporter [Ceratobasidium sp. AG-Ba]|nr:mitochondrial inner membrane magnesium transporter [Ceratobasidium sp. AG-Ba]